MCIKKALLLWPFCRIKSYVYREWWPTHELLALGIIIYIKVRVEEASKHNANILYVYFFLSSPVHLFENCLFAWIRPVGKYFIPDSYFLLLLHIMNNSFIWWQMRCPQLQAFHKHIWIVQFPSHCINSTLALCLLIFRKDFIQVIFKTVLCCLLS